MAKKALLVIDQGATFTQSFTALYANGAPIDLTGGSFAGKMRKHAASANSVDFVISSNADISQYTLSVAANVTAAMDSARYIFDVELTTSGNTIIRLIEGLATVTPSSTY